MDASLICDRDPTMDARIVHSVSVSNKKEQSTLRHKERSLKSAKNVQEHIHRQEEKELMRQLNKLQDEKGRRHPDILDSRSHSRSSRTNSRVSAPDNDIHQILQMEPQPSHPVPTGGMAASSHLMSRVSTHRAALKNPRQSSQVMKGGLLQSGVSLATFGGGLGAFAPGSSKHTINAGMMSSQISNLTLESNQAPPPVHQPAGYGHTIKEQVKREGLNKKRPAHSYMNPKGSQRRSSVNSTLDDILKGCQSTQSRSNDSSLLGNSSSRAALNAALTQARDDRTSVHNLSMRPSMYRSSGSIHRVPGPSAHRMGMPSRMLLSGLFGGQSLIEVPDTDIEQQQQKVRAPLPTCPSDSDEDSSVESKSEKVLNVTHASHEDVDNGADESTGKVRFKEEETERASKSPQVQRGKLGVSDHVVAARKRSMDKEKQTSKKSERKTSQTSDKSAPKSSKKATSKSSHVVKLGGSEMSGRAGSTATLGAGSLNHIQIPIDTLYELRAALGSTLHGERGGIDDGLSTSGAGQPLTSNSGSSCAYDPSSNSMHNRRLRSRLRALQIVNSQLEALKQQQSSDMVSNFNPLEILRCRYLRLSESNIETLTSLCRDAGIEVGLHPHMNIEDIGKFVFESDKLVSGSSSSSGEEIKHIIV